MGLLLFLMIVAQIPSVQTNLLRKIANATSGSGSNRVEIGFFNLKWFDKGILMDVSVYDHHDTLMASIDQVVVDLDFLSLIRGENIHLNRINGNHVYLNFCKYENENEFNLLTFIDNSFGKNKNNENGRPLLIDKISLNESRFTFSNSWDGSLEKGFNPTHFEIFDLNGSIQDFMVNGDSILFYAKNLEAGERISGLEIENLTTNFLFSSTEMHLVNLKLKTSHSYISDSITFNYVDKNDLAKFVDSVTISASLNNQSYIGTQDLALFVPLFNNYQDTYGFSGKFDGPISDFIIQNFQLTAGKGTVISGRLGMEGIPNTNELFIDARLTNSTLIPEDTRNYLPTGIHPILDNLNKLDISGNYFGYLYDFVANGTFKSSLGYLNTDINIKIEDNKDIAYTGDIEMKDFSIGTALGIDELNKTSMNGRIEGTGLSLESADFELEANFNYLDLLDYRYQNIHTSATLAQSYFDGILNIKDKNLVLNTNTTIDLRDTSRHIAIKGQVDTLFLNTFNLTRDSVFIRTNIEVDFNGLHPDSLDGYGYFNNIIVQNRSKSIKMDSISIDIERKDNRKRELKLFTPYASGKIDGEYSFFNVFPAISSVIREYQYILRNNEDSLQDYIANRDEVLPLMELNYELSLTNTDYILNFFDLPLGFSQNSVIKGAIITGDESYIRLTLNADTIHYAGNLFMNNTVDLNALKLRDSVDILAALDIFSEAQQLGSLSESERLIVDASWEDSLITFSNYLTFDSANLVELNGNLIFTGDTINIHFTPSYILALNEPWQLAESNTISLSKEGIEIDNLSFQNQDKKIEIDGGISKNPDKAALLSVQNFDLSVLNALMQNELDGTLNGSLTLRNLYGIPTIDNQLNIKNLYFGGFLIGDVSGISILNNQDNQLDLRYSINRKNVNIITIDGYYDLDNEQPLYIDASFDKANLAIVEPFIEDLFTNIKGTITGEFSVRGTPSVPSITGKGVVENGGIRINYLNTSYALSGPIAFDQQIIKLNDLMVTDRTNEKATLSGTIRHNGLSDVNLNLVADMQNFEVLNTSSRDNPYFYGQARVSGNATISGPAENLLIKSNARSEKGTRIYIPVNETETVTQKEYISFVSFTDSSMIGIDKEEILKEKINLEGVSLDFDLDVTEDAYCEIIFDIKSGDIIRARGNGLINLQITSDGEFNMVGNYTIESGGYNFTMYNIINKEFNLLPGSTISWSGDPYGAQMNIQASYDQLTSLQYILPQNTGETTEEGTESSTDLYDVAQLRRKYPAKVLLDLEGDLMSPEIGFDIGIDNYPESVQLTDGTNLNLDLVVSQFQNQLENDEQELKRQIFSLLILRRLSYPNSFSVGGSIENSVSELISNQLSYWINQVDQNLEVDIDLAALDEEAFNTFQLRLSYTFLDGRLRVTRDGSFTNAGNQAGDVPIDQTQSDIATIAGDWTVEYLLTPDGKLRAKMYNRTTPSSIIAEQTNTVAGFSIELNQSFDKVKEIFSRTRERGLENKKSEEKINSDDKKAEAIPESNTRPN